jgi:hypothetical protein
LLVLGWTTEIVAFFVAREESVSATDSRLAPLYQK